MEKKDSRIKKCLIIIIRNYFFKKVITENVLLMKSIRIFGKINFEAVNSLQKTDLNQNLL